MRTRQKIILSILLHSNRKPSQTQLMKWLFLLKQESLFKNDPAFYDFLPYKFGPFSFEVYRDINFLTNSSYLKKGELSVSPELLPEILKFENSLSIMIRQSIKSHLDSYGGVSTRNLVETVYRRYPWFASRNKQLSVPKRIDAPLAVYTIGYQGKSIDLFLDDLLKCGIKALIDIRSSPISRKYGFSKIGLTRLTEKVEIKYFHFPELGVQRILRKQLGTLDEARNLLDYYEQVILPNNMDSCQQISNLVENEPSALMCFEKDAQWCHRNRLANLLSRTTRLDIIHL